MKKFIVTDTYNYYTNSDYRDGYNSGYTDSNFPFSWKLSEAASLVEV